MEEGSGDIGEMGSELQQSQVGFAMFAGSVWGVFKGMRRCRFFALISLLMPLHALSKIHLIEFKH
jgi:hypothetical protein